MLPESLGILKDKELKDLQVCAGSCAARVCVCAPVKVGWSVVCVSGRLIQSNLRAYLPRCVFLSALGFAG